MDDFRLLLNLTNDDLYQYDIHCVRIFLKVTTLSGSGMHLTEDAFAARPLSDRMFLICWPCQLLNTTRQRNLWKTALDSAYTSPGAQASPPPWTLDWTP